MERNNWQNLQKAWKQEQKPTIDIDSLRKEVKKRESLRKLRLVVETVIVLSVIIYTVHRLTAQPDFFGYLILGQLWFITILALGFNIWNRFSWDAAGKYSHKHYLNLLIEHSMKKKKTAVFVFALTLTNLSFYAVLFLKGNISFTTGAILRVTGLLLIYTVWSAWYYRAATSDTRYYKDELSKMTAP